MIVPLVKTYSIIFSQGRRVVITLPPRKRIKPSFSVSTEVGPNEASLSESPRQDLQLSEQQLHVATIDEVCIPWSDSIWTSFPVHESLRKNWHLFPLFPNQSHLEWHESHHYCMKLPLLLARLLSDYLKACTPSTLRSKMCSLIQHWEK